MIRHVNESDPGFQDDLLFYRLGAYVDKIARIDVPIEQIAYSIESRQFVQDIGKRTMQPHVNRKRRRFYG